MTNLLEQQAAARGWSIGIRKTTAVGTSVDLPTSTLVLRSRQVSDHFGHPRTFNPTRLAIAIRRALVWSTPCA